MATPLSLFKTKPKMVLFPEKIMEIDPKIHIYVCVCIYIYRINVTMECYKHIYMATPLSVLKKSQLVLLPEKKNVATDLKLGT